jgi:hypothetical protein
LLELSATSKRRPTLAATAFLRHVFQQLQGVWIGDSADGMTEPELSQIVRTSCSLLSGRLKSLVVEK